MSDSIKFHFTERRSFCGKHKLAFMYIASPKDHVIIPVYCVYTSITSFVSAPPMLNTTMLLIHSIFKSIPVHKNRISAGTLFQAKGQLWLLSIFCKRSSRSCMITQYQFKIIYLKLFFTLASLVFNVCSVQILSIDDGKVTPFYSV